MIGSRGIDVIALHLPLPLLTEGTQEAPPSVRFLGIENKISYLLACTPDLVLTFTASADLLFEHDSAVDSVGAAFWLRFCYTDSCRSYFDILIQQHLTRRLQRSVLRASHYS